MKRYIPYILGAALLAGGCTAEQLDDIDTTSKGTFVTQADAYFKPGMVYVKLQKDIQDEIRGIATKGSISLNNVPSRLATTLNSIGATDIRRLFPIDPRFEERKRREGLDCWYVVRFDEKQNLDQTIQTLSSNSDFVLVEKVPLATFPSQKAILLQTPLANTRSADMPFNDPYLSAQWHYQNFGTTPNSTAGADINLFEAWKQTTGIRNVIVAIVDGGIDYTHEDLSENMWINPNEIPGNGIDDDGNGYIDDIYGYNFSANQGEITLDDAGHGTHVAGTVAARNNNGIGVAGVAGGDGTAESGARLMSCQIFEDNRGGDSEAAIVYGADNGAVISQNSWGYDYPGPGSIPAATKAAIDYFIKYAGCDNDGNQLPGSPMKGGVVIFAAGNDDQDYHAYPSAYEEVISVSAMAPDWTKAWYTNRGDWVDIMAPGGDEFFVNGMVYSTVPPSLYGTGYGFMQGTSMACPHVSGIAALIVSKLGGEGFTNEELKQRILGSLRPENIDLHNPAYTGRLGIGYIDAALTFAENQNFPPANVANIEAEAQYTSMTLSWKAVEDQDDGTAVKYYLYFSDQPLTADNYRDITPYTINAYGYKPGETITYQVGRLKENTQYHAAIIATDRWGLESELIVKDFQTLKNDPPVISGLPESTIRISGLERQEFTVSLSDPNGHTLSYELQGETRGVSATREDDQLHFTIRAVAPLGEYQLELVVTDELGASTSAAIPFEIYEYQIPSILNPIQDMLIGQNEPTHQVDLSQYFSGTDLTYTAQSSNESIAIVQIEGNSLIITAQGDGEASITVNASDGRETIQDSFQIRIVENTDALVYQIYPIPVTTKLNILLNPAITRIQVSIRTVMGEEVISKAYNVARLQPVAVDVRRLTAGVYTLVIETSRGQIKKTFVKQ